MCRWPSIVRNTSFFGVWIFIVCKYFFLVAVSVVDNWRQNSISRSFELRVPKNSDKQRSTIQLPCNFEPSTCSFIIKKHIWSFLANWAQEMSVSAEALHCTWMQQRAKQNKRKQKLDFGFVLMLIMRADDYHTAMTVECITRGENYWCQRVALPGHVSQWPAPTLSPSAIGQWWNLLSG